MMELSDDVIQEQDMPSIDDITLEENPVTGDAIDLTLKNTPPALNALIRKCMMIDVKTYAVEEVQLIAYTGEEPWLHVASKIGAFAFKNKTDNNNMKRFELRISAKASDIRKLTPVTRYHIEPHPSLEAVDDGTIACNLRGDQVLDAKIIVTLRSGSHHERWSPAVAVSTFPLPRITIARPGLLIEIDKEGESVPSRVGRALIQCCPEAVFQFNKNSSTMDIEVERCTMCRQCDKDFSEAIGLVLAPDETLSRMHIETTGVCTPLELLQSTYDLLKRRLDGMQF